MSDLFGDQIRGPEYVILLDKRWQLDDLTKFSKAYEESYFAVFGLLSVAGDGNDDYSSRNRVSKAFRSYPWVGGYSAVNFFQELERSVPRKQRPTIRRISYASPGFIELLLDQHVAVQVGASVTSLCGMLKMANSTYHGIYKSYIERKLARISVEKAQLDLDREQMIFVKDASRALASLLNISDVEALHASTGNELRTLKILLAVFRRLKKLADLQLDGKVKLDK